MADPITGAVGSVLHSALRGLAERQRVVSDNIANLETPGFLAGRVDFESQLRDAIEGGDTAPVSPTIARSLEPTRTNGNNVNLDRETLLHVETGLRYNLTLRALDNRFSEIRTALRAGA